jgi:hypothetical protein
MTIPDHHKIYIALTTAALGVLIWVGVEFALTERIARADADTTLTMVNTALKGQHKNGDDGLLFLTKNLLQNATAAANALKQTAQDANRIAKAEEPQTAQVTQQLVNATTAGFVAIQNLDGAISSLNGVIGQVSRDTIPRFNANLDSLKGATDSLDGLVGDLRPTAAAATKLLDAGTLTVTELKTTIGTADALLADPDLKKITANLVLMSDNGNKTMGNLALVTMDVHNMLNPRKPTFWEAFAELGAKSVLGAAAAPLISHFWPLGINVKNTVTTVPGK